MVEFDFDHLQSLAHLKLDENEKQKLQDQVGRILKHVENLSEVDTHGIVPTFTMESHGTPLRPDILVPFENLSGIMDNAPLAENNAFRVPKILADK